MPEDPPFDWTEDDVAAILDVPFDTGFIIFGHDLWIKARDKAQKAYKRFAYAFNRLGFRNPVYVVLFVALVNYVVAICKCFMQSWAIKAAADALKGKTAKKEDAKPEPAPAA